MCIFRGITHVRSVLFLPNMCFLFMLQGKRIIGIIGTIITLITSSIADSSSLPQANEAIDITDTVQLEEVYYPTHEDFEKLYTYKQDIRKTDPNIIELSTDDAYLLMSVARIEAGPGLKGQLWIMNTIYNRYEQGWGDSLWDILNDETQFEVVTSGRYQTAEINSNSHHALALLESGYDPTEGALYWESNTNSPNSWHKKNLTFIKEVGGNLYYK